MKVSNNFDGWRPSGPEVRSIIDLFAQADDAARRTRFAVLEVTDADGSSWKFDTLEEFLDELARDSFTRFLLATDYGSAELTVSCSPYATQVNLTLPQRDQMQSVMADVAEISRQ